MTENDVGREVVDGCYQIHTKLGPGLLESAYGNILGCELTLRGLRFVRQVIVPVAWGGVLIEQGFRADFIVEDLVILEIKAVDGVLAVHKQQLRTYLKLMDKRLGLLINFNTLLIKDGISRVVNGLN
jgi:GxxExxY protein